MGAAGALDTAGHLSVGQPGELASDLALEPGDEPGLTTAGVLAGILAGPPAIRRDLRAQAALAGRESAFCGTLRTLRTG